jgi:hypothetical protein
MIARSVVKNLPIVWIGGSAGGLDIRPDHVFKVPEKRDLHVLNDEFRLDMPESAIENWCIDFILSPEDIAKEIMRIMNTGKKQA